jgi:hypothetical protein
MVTNAHQMASGKVAMSPMPFSASKTARLAMKTVRMVAPTV